jgi:dolichol-phosphate mannosyltransferase/undecaprenyl-phosphate 4-deoxy-4-formamido-L-arabinose transferase
MDYSVVVPVYQSAATLPELCTRLRDVLEPLGGGYEIVLVDDGSRDGTWATMNALHDGDPRINIVRLQRNFGQHAAVLCGLRYAQGQLVVTLDDDLQNPPEEIPRLIAAFRDDEGCDGVIGVPREKRHPLFRRLGSAMLNRITTRVFGKDPDLRMSSFRLLRRSLVDRILDLRMPEPAISPMLLLTANRLKNVEVHHDARRVGRSGYSLAKLRRLTYNNILNFSSLPLQLVSQLGLFSALVSVVLLGYFLWRAQFVTVSGWTSIVVLITFFSGVILFALGIIGEYLVRIIKATNGYPQYLVAAARGVERIPDKADRDG